MTTVAIARALAGRLTKLGYEAHTAVDLIAEHDAAAVPGAVEKVQELTAHSTALGILLQTLGGADEPPCTHPPDEQDIHRAGDGRGLTATCRICGHERPWKPEEDDDG